MVTRATHASHPWRLREKRLFFTPREISSCPPPSSILLPTDSFHYANVDLDIPKRLVRCIESGGPPDGPDSIRAIPLNLAEGDRIQLISRPGSPGRRNWNHHGHKPQKILDVGGGMRAAR